MTIKKRFSLPFAGGLLLLCCLLAAPSVSAAPKLVPASPSPQTFLIDGVETTLCAYLIEDGNCVRLRDLAQAVDFGVRYDAEENRVLIDPYGGYTDPAAAQPALPSGTVNAWRSAQAFYVDGRAVPLTAFVINGSNFIPLREIAELADFSVDYDAAAKTVRIDSTLGYEDGGKPKKPAGFAASGMDASLWDADALQLKRGSDRFLFRLEDLSLSGAGQMNAYYTCETGGTLKYSLSLELPSGAAGDCSEGVRLILTDHKPAGGSMSAKVYWADDSHGSYSFSLAGLKGARSGLFHATLTGAFGVAESETLSFDGAFHFSESRADEAGTAMASFGDLERNSLQLSIEGSPAAALYLDGDSSLDTSVLYTGRNGSNYMLHLVFPEGLAPGKYNEESGERISIFLADLDGSSFYRSTGRSAKYLLTLEPSETEVKGTFTSTLSGWQGTPEHLYIHISGAFHYERTKPVPAEKWPHRLESDD